MTRIKLPPLPDRDEGFDRNASHSEDRYIGTSYSDDAVLTYGLSCAKAAQEAAARAMHPELRSMMSRSDAAAAIRNMEIEP